ncbi:indole-3-glycerol phosphate synthase TrpC [Kurthia sibirica]|uniref:Indole-3-glycerol phosphate synthase n=1 Tax=Kurthia sibirica TaxID=202750 RepID=A0A2U3AN55_9BACL|nr:indole-3-glycerol phosphate synthase TrpC [Kurthia sibirica]PWI25962.1 indole-3-glycerol phosphate synthase TrpC [Kurthia sibirica]GEK35006.1 indole-3-glycerol phosphate synthase [Kurthia sibirica]
MTILQQILDEKVNKVAELKMKKATLNFDLPLYSLYDALIQKDTLQIIAEIKRASPSKGIIKANVDVVKQAQQYEAAGAACISVLTDEPFFKGSYEDLRKVAQAVSIPVLCKDFILDEIQIDYARANGASVILLIVAALESERLRELYTYANQMNLAILVEVHSVEEYERAHALGAKIIGINNRNLKNFEVDLKHTQTIAKAFSNNTDQVLVSESGIKNTEDAKMVSAYGASAILVGETLMKSENVEAALQMLAVKKVREVE